MSATRLPAKEFAKVAHRVFAALCAGERLTAPVEWERVILFHRGWLSRKNADFAELVGALLTHPDVPSDVAAAAVRNFLVDEFPILGRYTPDMLEMVLTSPRLPFELKVRVQQEVSASFALSRWSAEEGTFELLQRGVPGADPRLRSTFVLVRHLLFDDDLYGPGLALLERYPAEAFQLVDLLVVRDGWSAKSMPELVAALDAAVLLLSEYPSEAFEVLPALLEGRPDAGLGPGEVRFLLGQALLLFSA